MTNVSYQTAELARYFAGHRDKWTDFYPSERWMIERIAEESNGLGRVLDVGCAAGGLGRALASRGLLKSYAGIDINRPVIDAATRAGAFLRSGVRFECGDILRSKAFRGESFDTVFNLSCADWNVETSRIIGASWRKVAPGGRLVISLRLTPGRGLNDIRKSYQPITGSGRLTGREERANYAVFNVREALHLFDELPGAGRLLGYGYWGKPSRTAVTPYRELVFAVFALQKGKEDRTTPSMELRLPRSLFI
jgi:SAM-dependent methyltransferase